MTGGKWVAYGQSMKNERATKSTIYLRNVDRARITLIIERGHAINGASAIRYALAKATGSR